MEVVFSIGVATIGLLAAVALLPVAARQVELGLIADQAAAAGEAAQQNVDVIGVRNPLQWRTLVWVNGANYAPMVYGRNLTIDIDFDQGFRQAAYDADVLLAPSAPSPGFTARDRPPHSPPINSFCIDPFLLSEPSLREAANAAAVCDRTANEDVRDHHAAAFHDLQLFPYFARHPYDDGNANPTTPVFNMRRLSLGDISGAFSPAISWMNASQAERLFTVPDDLTFLRPESDRTLPALQGRVTLDVLNPTPNPSYRFTMKRETYGDLSWMVTFVPLLSCNNASTYSAITNGAAAPFTRQAPINNEIGSNATYTMSIVVHRRRVPARLNVIPGTPPPNSTPAQYTGATPGLNRNGINGQPSDEMVAQILPEATRGFLSSGFGGGDVVIEAPLNNATPLNHIRANDWVLLSGFNATVATNFNVPVPLGTATLSRNVGNGVAPTIRHQWYRVVNVSEAMVIDSAAGQKNSRIVTLEGPDWTPDVGPVQVTIVPSVVAVFEKTVTLAFPLK